MRRKNIKDRCEKRKLPSTMNILSCAFNMDTACVELKLADGTLISIDCTAVENEIADQRSELDYLIYNDPVAYADLILNGDTEAYLKVVTEYNALYED